MKRSSKQMPGRRVGMLAGVACVAMTSGAVLVTAPDALGAERIASGGTGAVGAANTTTTVATTAVTTTAVTTTVTVPIDQKAATKTPGAAGHPTASPAEERQVAAAASVIAFARRQLGAPYIWGGTGPRGFDCSGLIQKAFAVAGVHLPRGSIAQSHAGSRISRTQLIPGDLVFSNGYNHVQLYIGDGKVVEAARPGTSVRISKMLPAWMINAYVRVALVH